MLKPRPGQGVLGPGLGVFRCFSTADGILGSTGSVP